MVKPHKGVPEPTKLPEYPPARASAKAKFPGSREYLGTIQTSAGAKYKVYMPKVADYADLNMSKPESMYELGARSIGIPYSEFQDWGFPDGQRVMDKLSEAIDRLGAK